MPIYEYHSCGPMSCDHCEGGFEVMRKISDEPLKLCPHCFNPIERKVSRPNLAAQSPSMDESNIEKHGFTQFKKVEKGVYEKTAGKGPDYISDKE